MSRIRILPDILSNKIAAGEVVERPASVVKELVENAVDAGSGRVMVEIEQGGKSLIRVSDNGCGMSPDDALLAIERFATSKIRTDDDLFNIGTLGFRGEALPSIAAVSRFTLITRAADSDSGFSVRIDGGKLAKAGETGAPIGTMITVGQLFYNTPARRKFLKTVNTEMGHIGDVVSSMAMARPGIHFRLIHNARTVKDFPATGDFLRRIADVLGESLTKSLYPVDFADDSVTVSGAVASPRVYRTTPAGVYIFVNGRYIKDRTVRHAIFQGYGQRLMKGQFPAVVLFLQVPPRNVDVNVHPTKHEVRFFEQKKVHDAVKRAVEEALKRNEAPFRPRPEKQVENPGVHVSETANPYVRPEEDRLSFPGSPAPESKSDDPGPISPPSDHSPAPRAINRTAPTTPEKIPPGSGEQSPKQRPLFRSRSFSDLKLVGQCHDTYIVLESPDAVILLDQHAAHERVLYETLKQKATMEKAASQRLLVPETFDMGFAEADLLEKLIPEFEQIGLYIEPFGGNTFAVKAVPALLVGKEIQPVVREIVEKALQSGVNRDLRETLDESLKLMACHGAIRAGQKLSEPQIKGLLEQLDGCETPSNCPHGRPTWIRWELKSLEKTFHRIV